MLQSDYKICQQFTTALFPTFWRKEAEAEASTLYRKANALAWQMNVNMMSVNTKPQFPSYSSINFSHG